MSITYKVLFLDIDGTILTPEDTIQDSTKKAVQLMKEKGLEVFLATGRPLHEISHIGETLAIESFIGYNGAYAIHNGKDVFRQPMSPDLVTKYLDIANEKGNELILYTNTHNLLSHPEEKMTKQFSEKFHLKQNRAFTLDEKANILGITIINLREEDISLYEDFPDIHLSQVNIDGFRHSYDVISDKVNKGFAVSLILKRLGIDKEASIAFGDGLNDKEMLQVVGEGFAMGNAHELLFSYAKHTTTSVTDSGIYNGLKWLGLIEE
ncbi:Cof-like hydrolase [Niallia circulans]|uniref:Hydrolase n=1 Tax=Niallia circulans TaxID=1397 RepID=A0A0J1IQ22_NIACI|nr:HAD family hydrolase [Niallia circulans]KLV28061.1 hydrolase [Niallia circulans]MCM2980411.1 Cof-type HAD-IIB family hydrolase [Niallia circulans]MDR4314885.1 Cof-type HAD-IIB family hydrolase [Niallia circulans]MED3837801.1 HAD family hydrolase [Niallia circulans]MED4243052.1 HAD family hydrolase [Niallia circulans]